MSPLAAAALAGPLVLSCRPVVCAPATDVPARSRTGASWCPACKSSGRRSSAALGHRLVRQTRTVTSCWSVMRKIPSYAGASPTSCPTRSPGRARLHTTVATPGSSRSRCAPPGAAAAEQPGAVGSCSWLASTAGACRCACPKPRRCHATRRYSLIVSGVISSRRPRRRVIRRNTNRKHMIGDHHGPDGRESNPAGQSRGRHSRHAPAVTARPAPGARARAAPGDLGS